MIARIIRYQGAIIHEHQLLLIKHKSHDTGREIWLLPGGGIEEDEAEEVCVCREMREETSLEVAVERLLLDDPAEPGWVYQRLKTYLCRIVSGEAQPGYEPEEDASSQYAISQVGWFDLRDSSTWDKQVFNDLMTLPVMHRIQKALGYEVRSA
jgi:ADP-ribose pyrophosphatase YjhB (NUDIX family)